jgi:2-polyprenyl-3-methyl-5-hydroxy-6-metoxy-1,4-benzoquinol methylase
MPVLRRSRSGPKSVLEGLDVTCPACGSAGRPLSLVVEPGCRLVRCRSCGTQYLRRIVGDTSDQDRFGGADVPEAGAAQIGTDSEYWESYKFAVYDSDDVRRGYDERYDLAFELLRSHDGEPSSVLDVGCGVGNFLDWARRHGLDAAGVDVEPRAVIAARERGLKAAVPDELDRLLGDSGKVDVLTLWDVIEHVFEPDSMLRSVLPHVAPGGAILLETPDAAFPVRILFRALHRLSGGRIDLVSTMYYWEHKIYFTEEGLRRLLAANGCELVEVRRLTSPRAKMAHTFSHNLEQHRSLGGRLVAGAWPLAERFFRRLGWGNKLVVLARRLPSGERGTPAVGDAA